MSNKKKINAYTDDGCGLTHPWEVRSCWTASRLETLTTFFFLFLFWKFQTKPIPILEGKEKEVYSREEEELFNMIISVKLWMMYIRTYRPVSKIFLNNPTKERERERERERASLGRHLTAIISKTSKLDNRWRLLTPLKPGRNSAELGEKNNRRVLPAGSALVLGRRCH